MSLDSLLTRWKTDPGIGPNITAWHTIPAREPSIVPFPPGISKELIACLEQQSIHSLYSHQSKAWEVVNAGKNVVITTGTSSGKSLAYQLPVLDRIISNPASKALFLFPTKALAQDQADWLKNIPGVTSSVYDGDTPGSQRPAIRENAQIVISNPDMLHVGILPYHIQWSEFIRQLDFVIIDEMHTYRGVFGSHVANVIRRLKRIANHYNAAPQFILTSATIGNPEELAARLIEESVEVVNTDGSSRGEKHFLIYNPPVIDPGLGLRASMQGESIRLAADLISTGNQTILFGRSRRSVEFMLRNLKKSQLLHNIDLRSYRSGYLKSDRREIEQLLRNGTIRGITATNALELGVDIGSLDAAILSGYPGSVAATWQQAGRSGRTERASVSILVVASSPIDQYLSQHPSYLFGDNIEAGLVDPDNLLIILSHLQCAVYELPFKAGESFGGFDSAEVEELLAALEQLGKIYFQNESYYWMDEDYPAAQIPLRTASSRQIILTLRDERKKLKTVGSVDYESALWMVHPGAIYLHGDNSYLVEELDLDENRALLTIVHPDYYTESEMNTTFEINDLLDKEGIQGGNKALGDITVTSLVTSFKKISWRPYQVLSREQLDLPAITLPTIGFWITLSEDIEEHLKKQDLWTSSPNDYGPNWNTLRGLVLERDNHQCQYCSAGPDKSSLHIHHKQPLRAFQNLADANHLSNLITLCSRCHQRAESIVRVQSGIRGLGHVLHGLAPLLVMCDPSDIGLHTDFQSPFGDGRPIVLIYDHVPGGIGFSRSLYAQTDRLFSQALELVSTCQCDTGCPSCVGPGGELGAGGKAETMAILTYFCGIPQGD